MIHITYLRSSSYNAWSFCQQRYFLEYGLGMKSPSNKAADKGSIVHKSLELLAHKRLTIQEHHLSFRDEELNETCSIELSVEQAMDLAWQHYTKTLPTSHQWTQADYDICLEWTNKAMNLSGGFVNPLKRTVIWPERYFDFTIEEPWAHYQYTNADGSKLEGQLGIKGTVDLVCAVDGFPNTVELIDWKTGKRKDWATDKIKEWKDLRQDPQLRLYHYAVCRLCPEIEHVIVTIVFINDGGSYSLDFHRADLAETEAMIRKRFEIIRNCERPKLIYPNWKCERLCAFGKNNWPDSDKTICAHIQQETVQLGIERVTQKYAVASNYEGGGRRVSS